MGVFVYIIDENLFLTYYYEIYSSYIMKDNLWALWSIPKMHCREKKKLQVFNQKKEEKTENLIKMI